MKVYTIKTKSRAYKSFLSEKEAKDELERLANFRKEYDKYSGVISEKYLKETLIWEELVGSFGESSKKLKSLFEAYIECKEENAEFINKFIDSVKDEDIKRILKLVWIDVGPPENDSKLGVAFDRNPRIIESKLIHKNMDLE